jgi:hypothetical protein
MTFSLPVDTNRQKWNTRPNYLKIDLQ